MAIQTVFETTGSSLVGTTVAALMGANPFVGTGLAALAYLVTEVAIPALQTLPNLEDHDLLTREFLATLTVIAAWCASVAQIGQIALQHFGYVVPFAPAAAITTASILLGRSLGEWIYVSLTQEKSFD